MVAAHREALRSLGKIGAPAARAIRGSRIYEDSPGVAQRRERVLARIEPAEDAWVLCPRSDRGKVLGRLWDQQHTHCATCLGLGFIPRAGAAV